MAALGLAASEIFEDEISNFERRYGSRLTLDEYQVLNRLLVDMSADAMTGFAKDVVSLSERFVRSTEVFVIMSFAEHGHLLDAYDTFGRVCRDCRLKAFKVDDHLDHHQRIVPNILEAIRRSAFIIADVTEPRPNVFYELGYAQALGKDVITTARDGTVLPFDIFDVPTQFWDSQRSLEQKLRQSIKRLDQRRGWDLKWTSPD